MSVQFGNIPYLLEARDSQTKLGGRKPNTRLTAEPHHHPSPLFIDPPILDNIPPEFLVSERVTQGVFKATTCPLSTINSSWPFSSTSVIAPNAETANEPVPVAFKINKPPVPPNKHLISAAKSAA